MNFSLVMALFLLISCGVKGDPTAPKNQNLPTVLENYEDINLDRPLDENKILKK